MFALGVFGALFIRWMNVRPVYPKPPQMDDQKLMRMADKIARQQVQNEQWAHFERNQEIQRPVGENIQESFAPSKK
jgi:hypothetical protein